MAGEGCRPQRAPSHSQGHNKRKSIMFRGVLDVMKTELQMARFTTAYESIEGFIRTRWASQQMVSSVVKMQEIGKASSYMLLGGLPKTKEGR